MGIMVHSLIRVMQDLYHPPKCCETHVLSTSRRLLDGLGVFGAVHG